MINAVSVTTPTANTRVAIIHGNFDDGVSVTRGIVKIVYSELTAGQQTVFTNFIDSFLKTDKNVSMINLPNNSEFSIDYITNVATFIDSQVEYDYSLLGGVSQGYVDDFNSLILDLL